MKEKIKKYLDCDDEKAVYTEKKLSEIDERLKPLLTRWLEEDIERDDTLFYGHSINSLMDKYQMKFTGALLTLDWLLKNPVAAEKALKYGIR